MKIKSKDNKNGKLFNLNRENTLEKSLPSKREAYSFKNLLSKRFLDKK